MMSGVPATLQRVVELLGSAVVHQLVPPRPVDRPVSGLMLLDLARDLDAELGAESDALLLAVGLLPSSNQVEDVVKHAAAGGYTGLVVKAYGENLDVLAISAAQAGLAVLVIDDDLPWRHVDGFIGAALGSPTAERSGGMSSVAVGDLFALANAVAAMVGGAVTIEDTHQKILAYSTLEGQLIDEPRRQGILGRHVPEDMPTNAAKYRELWQSPGACHFDWGSLPDVYPRLAVAIRAGTEVIGSIWAVNVDDALGREAERALEDAAAIAALHLLRARSAEDVERRTRGDVLRALLDGRGTADVAVNRLGLPADQRLVVFGFEPADEEELPADFVASRLCDLVTMYCEAFRRHSITTSIGRSAYALLPVEEATAESALLTIARDIAERAGKSMRIAVRVGVGTIVESARGVHASRRDADLVLRVLAEAPHLPQVAAIEDVRSRIVLLELADMVVASDAMLLQSVARILAHDRERRTRYAETLVAYFDAFGDIAIAAGRLVVHPNTFRYRLRRAIEIFNLDLSDADERLVLWLQLRLRLPDN